MTRERINVPKLFVFVCRDDIELSYGKDVSLYVCNILQFEFVTRLNFSPSQIQEKKNYTLRAQADRGKHYIHQRPKGIQRI